MALRTCLIFTLTLSAWFSARTDLQAQPCLVSYALTAAPPPDNGTYQGGQVVEFCFTVTFWNSTSSNWFHGIAPDFGPGWDLSTLTPGPPPATCGGSGGTWGWYTSVQGTGANNIGPQGPGFFFDLDNDGNPGNNFGDFCTGPVDWQFCWTIAVADQDCEDGLSLAVAVNTFGDSETGSWGSTACQGDAVANAAQATAECCPSDAGEDGLLSICSSAPPVDLFTLLGGTPDVDGSWTDPQGNSVPGLLDPATATNGPYTYTVSVGVPPCIDEAEVLVDVIEDPDAGSDASIELCNSDGPQDLFALLGPDAQSGGTWTGPGGIPFNGTHDPLNDAPGAYTYFIDAPPPCVPASADVTVSVSMATDAGTDAVVALCSDGGTAELFGLLGGTPDPGGTWTAPDGLPFDGIHDPLVDAVGAYTYTVVSAAPCPDTQAVVEVSAAPATDAGTGAALILCNSEGVLDLFDLLEGSPQAGGSWTAPDGTAFDGTLDLDNAASGAYTYLVNGVPPCDDSQAVLDITIEVQPDAGEDASASLCIIGPSVDLFDLLGGSPDPGGTWTGPDGLVAPALLDPATALDGAYTYSITAALPCTDAIAVVNITILEQPEPGTDADQTICTSGDPVDLFDLLGGTPDAGGSWTDPFGNAHGGSFDPAADPPGTYQYNITVPLPCLSVSAVVDVQTLDPPPDGIEEMVSLCASDADVDLFEAFDGSVPIGGAWTSPFGMPASGTFDPGSDAPGVYTYGLSGPAPCPDGTNTVTVVVEEPPFAGNNGNASLCTSDDTFDLVDALGGSPDAGGSWSAPGGGAVGGSIDPGTAAAGSYTYTLASTALCAGDAATVEISITVAAYAGSDGQIQLCEDDDAVTLFDVLGGTPDAGGSWTGPDGSANAGTMDPASDPAGTYTYTVVAPAPCPVAQATVTITVDALPLAGSIASLTICAGGMPQNLFDLLGADAQAGGTWGGAMAVSGGVFDPQVHVGGTYSYTVEGTGGCTGAVATAEVVVELIVLPDASITVGPASGCVPLGVLLSLDAGSAEINEVVWDLGDGNVTVGGTSQGHLYVEAGSFLVSAMVTDANGCSGTVVAPGPVIVDPGPVVAFQVSPLTVSVDDPTIELQWNEQPGLEVQWNIGGLPVDGGNTFSHTWTQPEAGFQSVCLTLTNINGCSNTACIELLIDEPLTVHVPNAFTPDGDGINDIFLPIILGAEPGSYDLTIFDRWGNEVFRTSEPLTGWNGIHNNGGTVMPQAVYVWRLYVRDRFSTERVERFGSVTLVR